MAQNVKNYQEKCLTLGVKESRRRSIMLEKQITIRVDEKLYRSLEKDAKKRMRSVSSLIRLILTKNFIRSNNVLKSRN